MPNLPLMIMINLGSSDESEKRSPLEEALRGEKEADGIEHILRMMLAKMPSSTHVGGG